MTSEFLVILIGGGSLIIPLLIWALTRLKGRADQRAAGAEDASLEDSLEHSRTLESIFLES